MSHPGVTISRYGACVSLTGDLVTQAWVRDRGSRYFAFTGAAANPPGWHIIAGSEYAPKVRYPITANDTVQPDGCCYRLNLERHLIVVDAPAGAWRNLWTLRMVRHLLRWQLFQSGAVFLHGGAVAHGGIGIAFLGASRAGKTTLLLHSLRTYAASFIAEDDLTILQKEDGSLFALGWPGSVRLRRSMLSRFPEFAQIHRFQHPANPVEALRTCESARLHIFPEELSAAFGCTCLPEVPLQVVAHLQWAEQPSTASMDHSEVEALLKASWDILPERKPGTRPPLLPLNSPRWKDFCFNPFLLDTITMPNLEILSESLARYAQKVRGYHVRHSGDPSHLHDLFTVPASQTTESRAY